MNEALIAKLIRIAEACNTALNMDTPEHPAFADSAADVVDRLWEDGDLVRETVAELVALGKLEAEIVEEIELDEDA